ncbi:MAG: InlB B-repeat-containing protein [Clostridia bacterium]|nr:InlB B-repeat-containing protein [Clostridia bacterium]
MKTKLLAALLVVCLVLSVAAVAMAATTVTTAAELKDAIQNANDGDVITLGNDITISEKLSIQKSITIDGNGKKLTYTGSDRAIDVPKEAVGAAVTIKNLDVFCSGSYCERGINYNTNGSLVLDNVNVSGTNLNYAINLPGSADNCTVEIKGGSYASNIALNVWGSDSKITATDTTFTTIDNAGHEGYATIKLNNDGDTSAEGTIITINGGKVEVTGTTPNGSHALSNSTATGKIQISEVDVNGDSVVPVAIVDYGTYNFYSMTTLQKAINRAIEDGNGAKAKLLRDVDEVVEVNASVELDVDGHTNTNHIYLTAENVELTAAEGLNVYSKVDGYKVIYEDGVYKLVEGEEIIPVTVTFAANGGTGTMNSVEVNPGSYTLPANGFTAPEGKQFKAWNVDGKEYAAGDKVTIVDATTITAVWEAIPATATPTPAPAAPVAPAPKTGDNTNLVALSLLMAASFIGIVVLSKKRAHN